MTSHNFKETKYYQKEDYIMNAMISDYTFTVIEENKVPLAATFDSGTSYAPVIVAVLLMAVFVSLLAYTIWFTSHKSHILTLTGEDNGNEIIHYFTHPIKLLQMEYEIENRIVDNYIA